MKRETVEITEQNTFSTAIDLDAGEACVVAVSGNFIADWEIQIAEPGGTTWYRAEGATFDEPGAWTYRAPAAVKIRVGVPTGSFTSGTVAAVIWSSEWRAGA